MRLQGAEIMIRTAGYTAPIRDTGASANQANAFQNLIVDSQYVCMADQDRFVRFHGEGMIVNFDGSNRRPWHDGTSPEIITAEVRPDSRARGANPLGPSRTNIYQLWHRGYVAVKRRPMDCPYNLHAGHGAPATFRLPWRTRSR